MITIICIYNRITNRFKSKIAKIPTSGYCGHKSIFQKQISYINTDVDKCIDINSSIDINTSKNLQNSTQLSATFSKLLGMDKDPNITIEDVT